MTDNRIRLEKMADSDHDDDSDKSFDFSENRRSSNQVNDTHQSSVD